MYRNGLAAGSGPWSGRILAVVVAMIVVPSAGLGAERMVLCEEFTTAG